MTLNLGAIGKKMGPVTREYGWRDLVLYALGVAHYKLGNLGVSKAYFGKVLEVDPGHDDARGLMDIVANLERRQGEEPQPETASPEERDEVSQPAQTSPSGRDETGSAH